MWARDLRASDLGAKLSARARGRPAARRTASPRLHVIGNCQGGAVASAMRLLLPEADIRFTSVFGIAKSFRRMADLVAATRDCDAVFANAFSAPFRDAGTYETLRASVRLVPIPIVVFPAYHPDVVYVGRQGEEGGGLVYGPMGGYHSALVLFAFLEGWPEAQALRLLGPDAYRRVGYLGIWDEAVASLLELGRHADYDLGEAVMRWSRRGAFMHGINHPKIHVAADLARGLLAKAGIPFDDCDLDAYLADEMIRAGTWPVHRAVGEHYGVPWSELFLKAPTRKTGPARSMSVRAFVEASYGSYRRRDRALLVNERVAAWRGSDALRADLRAMAA